MTNDRLYVLIDHLYAATLQPDRWQSFVDALSDELGGHAISLALQMPGLEVPVRAYSARLDPDLVPLLEKHYRKGLPWVAGAMRAFLAGFVPMDELLSIEELKRSDFAAEWLAPQQLLTSGGLGHCFASEDDVPLAAIVVMEHFGGRALEPADRAFCDLLAPHLACAYQIYRRVGDEQHGRMALAAVVNRLPIGIVLLDRELRPVVTNRTADRVVALDDGFSLGTEGLCAANARDDAVMRDIFADIVEGRRSVEHGETMLSVSRPSGKRAFPVLVGMLHDASNGGVAEDATVSVIFGVPESGHTISPEALQAAYDLTPAEAELVGMLTEGLSLKGAARRRGVSLNTVRTQIKHVFAKTDTNRQGELIRLVLTGAAGFMKDPG
jgi:DNA-binding CsgD family transcriptional regulator/PAS domain-containing protein